jgi:hypothetical protein
MPRFLGFKLCTTDKNGGIGACPSPVRKIFRAGRREASQDREKMGRGKNMETK